MSITVKERVQNELAKTPDVWLDMSQVQEALSDDHAATVARVLRKLREEGKVLSQIIPGDRYKRSQWRYNQAGSSAPALTPVFQPQPACTQGNGKGIMSKPTLRAAVKIIIADFTKTAKTFSAHDVTSELRDRVNTKAIVVDPLETGTCHVDGEDVPRIAHAEIRDHIHDLFNQGMIADYDRSNNGTYWAYVPIVCDVNDGDDDGDDDANDGDGDGDGGNTNGAGKSVAVVAVSGAYDGSSVL